MWRPSSWDISASVLYAPVAIMTAPICRGNKAAGLHMPDLPHLTDHHTKQHLAVGIVPPHRAAGLQNLQYREPYLALVHVAHGEHQRRADLLLHQAVRRAVVHDDAREVACRNMHQKHCQLSNLTSMNDQLYCRVLLPGSAYNGLTSA